MAQSDTLRLYEALELRAEYDARLSEALEEARLSFRALNRAIRAAAFVVEVNFQDE